MIKKQEYIDKENENRMNQFEKMLENVKKEKKGLMRQKKKVTNIFYVILII